MRVLILLAAVCLTGSQAAFAVPKECAGLKDPKEIQQCQKRAIDKLGTLYFSVYDMHGKRYPVPIGLLGQPCSKVPSDGDYQFFRNKAERESRTPYRIFHCKAGRESAPADEPQGKVASKTVKPADKSKK